MTINLPESFIKTRYSPTEKELDFLQQWMKSNLNYKNDYNILEFGAGPSTWIMYHSVKINKYVCVEDHIPSVRTLLEHINDLTLVKGIWYQIPEDIKYDFIFVDSSAGYPPGDGGLHRDEAVKYGQRLLEDNGFIAIHDWHGRSGRAPRRYLEKCESYNLVASLKDRTGIGIYQKCG